MISFDIELENYETDMRRFLQNIVDKNSKDESLLNGKNLFEQEHELHFFWAFGIETHMDIHTSLAVLFELSPNIFMMLKIDLQDTSENILEAEGSKIYIMHEVRIVDGIDRKHWSESERAVDMSLEELFIIIKSVMEGMDKKYSILRNNCIR